MGRGVALISRIGEQRSPLHLSTATGPEKTMEFQGNHSSPSRLRPGGPEVVIHQQRFVKLLFEVLSQEV